MSEYTVADVPLGYAPVPPELVMYRDENGKALGGTELRFWAMLAMHRNLKTQRTKAGTTRISDMLKVDRTTAQRAANKLQAAGFLLHKPRARDPETGEWTPAEFTLAVGGRPMGVGIYTYDEEGEDEGAEEQGASAPGSETGPEAPAPDPDEDHDASAHKGDGDHDASTHVTTMHPRTTHEASAHNAMRHPRTSHDAHHDAHHDASAHEKPSINARAGRRGEEASEEDFPPGGADAPVEHPAMTMTYLTIDRTREVGFFPAPHQRANWGKGWAAFCYVPAGQEPPSAERQFAVLAEIVAAASGKNGKARYFLAVTDAVKRVEGKPPGHIREVPKVPPSKEDAAARRREGYEWLFDGKGETA